MDGRPRVAGRAHVEGRAGVERRAHIGSGVSSPRTAAAGDQDRHDEERTHATILPPPGAADQFLLPTGSH